MAATLRSDMSSIEFNNWITFLGLLTYPAAVMTGCLIA